MTERAAQPRSALPEPRDLLRRVDECMLVDQRRLRARLRSLLDRGNENDVRSLVEQIDRSIARRARRRQLAPKPTYPGDLPVSQKKDDIARAILAHQVVVVCGETGSGKTTQLPKICMELGGGIAGTIGHTQPRRIAARTVASRIAEELGQRLGQGVGYKIRFGDHTGEDTFVKLMTDGILLAETQHDRLLEHYDTLIIDEAHERSLNIDFLLGYVRQLLPKRPDLKVIITSATIDPERFARHFATDKGPAPIVHVSGRTYPVETLYRPLVADEDLHDDESGRPGAEIEDGLLRGLVQAVDEAAASGPGDMLVFLPGEREIREAAEILRKHHVPGSPSTAILPLYSRLTVEEQNKVFEPHPGRRIVLSTNVAETSLTVPGIRFVIDPGLARINRYSPRTKVQRLEIEPISRASADQRKGRCGRVGPGICVRLYSEQDFKNRDEFTDPEILRTNLASVILQMKALNLGAVEEFPFIEPPDPRMVKDGYETLRELGAVDEAYALTPLGRELARLPVDPRIGRIILAGDQENCLRDALIIAAAMSVQDPRVRPHEFREAADAAHVIFRDEASDFLSLLKIWRFYQDLRQDLSRSKLIKACKQNYLSFLRLREWEDVHHQLKSLVLEMGYRISDQGAAQPDAIHRALLAGLLSSVGKKSDAPPGSDAALAGDYAGCHGTRFSIFPGSSVFKSRPKWLVASELVRTTKLYARSVATIRPEWVERAGQHLLHRSYSDPHYDETTQRVIALEKCSLFGLVVAEGRRVHYGPINPREAREIFIQGALVAGLMKTDATFMRHNLQLQAQVEAMENKARRRDLLVDLQSRYDFYASRLGPDVYSSDTFDKWRKDAERKDAHALFMKMEDLLLKDAAEITPQHFPDNVGIAGSRLKLDYILAPGESADGITMNVPLEALNQVDAKKAEWIVPGLLPEKIEAIIKAIPKSARRHIGPPGEMARAIAPKLPFGEGDLVEAVRAAIEKETKVEMHRDLWHHAAAQVPFHLRMNFRVLGENGRELAQGRDLVELRKQLGVKVEDAFGKIGGEKFHQDALTSWDFGDLPERLELKRNAMTVVVYPALMDQKTGVGLRVVETQERAAELTRAGLRRLFVLKSHREIKHRLFTRTAIEKMAAQYAMVGGSDGLKEDLIALTAERAFMANRGTPRNKDQFEAAFDAGWSNIPRCVDEVAKEAQAVLEGYQIIKLVLDGPIAPPLKPVADDLKDQLSRLVYPGFLHEIPTEWIVHLPRYLAAMRTRVAKLQTNKTDGLSRDQRLADEVAVFWRAFKAREQLHKQAGVTDPNLALFRWLVEEFRVSQFAQELRTIVPVSAKRLQEQWNTIGKP